MRLILVMVTALVTGPASAAEIKMIVAQPARPMLEQAALNFGKSHPDIWISFETGPGPVLAKRLKNGEKFDLTATGLVQLTELQAEGVAQAVAPLATGVTIVVFKKGEPAPMAATEAQQR